MTKKGFIRKVEDFTCEYCGNFVAGDGYTNHCPKCLYSKHVDIVPGDRKASCGGLMKPILVTGTQKEYVLTHKCILCGYEKVNKVSSGDDFDTLISIIKSRKS